MGDPEVVVLAAMARELRPLARALRMRADPVGGLPAWRGRGIVAVAVGVGPERASAGTAQVLGQVRARRLAIAKRPRAGRIVVDQRGPPGIRLAELHRGRDHPIVHQVAEVRPDLGLDLLGDQRSVDPGDQHAGDR